MASVAQGGIEEEVFEAHGWTFHTRKTPIIGTQSHYLWKRELNCYQAQHLPEALWGDNSLEITHNATGITLHFNALEALRSWAALDLAPVQVPAATSGSWQTFDAADWDYTFTSAYPGSVTVLPRGSRGPIGPSRPDSSSFIGRVAVDVTSGTAQLRKPICKCKGDGGRPAFIEVCANGHPN